MIENKKYFIDLLNSSKANKMTALYHYSGVGFKKASLNLGIFRKTDKKLVGVLQWGCSYQESIRLDRYVKEPISAKEYLELNRFSMADSEGRNSESQAISLGIKWIKQNRPDIKLLVSYAGRKEGNYGYIYQATNWEYLGYFISNGFWFVDGEERHQMTLWYRHTKYGNPTIPMTEDLCNMYSDVRQYWSKQFIYIQRLDKNLTLASPILDYPKPSNEFPIITNEIIYKRNDEIFNNYNKKEREKVEYYWSDKEEPLFTRKALIRQGKIKSKTDFMIAQYDLKGFLEKTYEKINEIENDTYKLVGIRNSLKTNKKYKDKYFRYYLKDKEPQEEIEVPFICIIDEIYFFTFEDAGKYLGCSKQAVHQSSQRKSKRIKGKSIIWYAETPDEES